jgi:hypothetical protein
LQEEVRGAKCEGAFALEKVGFEREWRGLIGAGLEPFCELEPLQTHRRIGRARPCRGKRERAGEAVAGGAGKGERVAVITRRKIFVAPCRAARVLGG